MRSFGCLGFVSILCAAPAAIGQEPASRTITVTGSSTVRFHADTVKILFRIRSTEPTADEARQAIQKAVKFADEKLSGLKIKDLKVSYGPASLSQQVDRVGRAGLGGAGGGGPGGGARGGRGGAVESIPSFSSLQVGTLILHEKDKGKLADTIEKIEKALIESGAISTGAAVDDDFPTRALPSGLTLTMFRQDDSEFREEALTKAVQSALRKANAMAKGAGVQIKETVSIVENEDTTPRPDTLGPATRGVRSASSTAASSAPGELELTVRVTVKCSY
jgi:uncharacterized protein YggE